MLYTITVCMYGWVGVYGWVFPPGRSWTDCRWTSGGPLNWRRFLSQINPQIGKWVLLYGILLFLWTLYVFPGVFLKMRTFFVSGMKKTFSQLQISLFL